MRCVQPAALLRGAGYSTTAGCIYRDFPNCTRALVVHRVADDAFYRTAARLARIRGLPVIYDVDDLIFSTSGDIHLQKYGGETASGSPSAPYFRAMSDADVAIVSTTYLGREAATLGIPTEVIKNGVSDWLLDAGSRSEPASQLQENINIAYLSGSAHHDADLAIALPAIERVLQEYPASSFMLTGKIDVPDSLKRFGNRVVFEPFRPYSELPALFRKIDINIAPLDTGSPFAQARSELKYIEAGAFGIPTVASPTMSYQEAISDGCTGLLAGRDDWYAALTALLDSRELRLEMGARARRHVVAEYSPDPSLRRWLSLLEAFPQRPHRTRYFGAAIGMAKAGALLAKRRARRVARSIAKKEGSVN